MLTDQAIDEYVSGLTPEQQHNIRAVRALLVELGPAWTEVLDTGKWFGGLLTYSEPDGMFAYALGPRANGHTTFHMMPYYVSGVLQERHGAALKRFLSGKSCIRFKRYADLPEDALRAIIAETPTALKAMREERQRKGFKD